MLAGAGGLIAATAGSALAGNTKVFSASGRIEIIQIKRSGSQPSEKGPGEYFTGAVRIDARFSACAPARVGGATVIFEPGARTAWHTHPLGQTLIVTFAPGEKHWHGATPTSAMTHIAIAESLDGKAVDWMEKVGDEQYRR